MHDPYNKRLCNSSNRTLASIISWVPYLALLHEMVLNAGPLTTIFTPPTTCLDVITSGLSPYSPGYSLFIGHFGPYYSPALTCSPTATALINYYTDNYYWSPGYCPSGYTTACSYTPVNLGPKVTASLCCPMYAVI